MVAVGVGDLMLGDARRVEGWTAMMVHDGLCMAAGFGNISNM